MKTPIPAAPYSWQFDPLIPHGPIEITCHGVAFLNTSTLGNAQKVSNILNAHEPMLAALKEAENQIAATLGGSARFPNERVNMLSACLVQIRAALPKQ